MNYDLRSSGLQHNFIKERICNIEKHFYEFSSKLSIYNKKQANVRDSGTELAKSIERFAMTETLNNTLRSSLMDFSDLMRAIQEYRDTQVQRTDAKVVLEFKNYDATCKKAKADLKRTFKIRAEEINKKNQLEKARGKNPTNWIKISQAERALNETKNEATRTMLEVSKTIDNFERQKLEDLKHAFLELIKIELKFHAKAVELYTSSYNVVNSINVVEDLKEFRDHFKSYASLPDPEVEPRAVLRTPSDSKPAPADTPQDPADASCSSLKSSAAALSKSSLAGSPDSGPKGTVGRGRRKTAARTGDQFGGGDESNPTAACSKFDFGDHCL